MWIKIKDREPSNGAEVLVKEAGGLPPSLHWIGEFSSEEGGFHIVGGGFLEVGDISCWMEIPPVPEEK